MTVVIHSRKDIKILGDLEFQGFFQDFLRKLWKSDKERNWSIYDSEPFRKFWDYNFVEHRGNKK